MEQKKKLCIIGLGYIGLPTAAMFATHGHKIVGVDINPKVVEALNAGQITIEEPYLDIMVQAAVTSGNLTASVKPEEADVFIIAVPTPITETKSADMRYVISAAESIVPYLKKGNIVVLESTSPPGTVKDLLQPILEKSGYKVGEELYVAHSPERVLPGQILMELVNNSRIIGGVNQKSAEEVAKLYRTFVKGEIYLTDETTAEMCKVMENTFRDVNIALANEMAMLCEELGINAWDVISFCNKHPRVNIHLPGPGVGGHCLAVDPWFIVEKFPKLANIIKLSRETNDLMPTHVFKKIENIMKIGKGRIVTIFGATYKADIDDTRESPVMELIELLLQENKYQIKLFDPHIKTHQCLVNDLNEAILNSDLLVLTVGHKEFKYLDYKLIYKNMRLKNLFDTRNFLNMHEMVDIGFSYHLLGKGNKKNETV